MWRPHAAFWKSILTNTAQKMQFSITDFFTKCEQIHSFLRIWSHLLQKFLIGNFHILCSVRHIYDHALFLPAGTFTSNFYEKKVEQKKLFALHCLFQLVNFLLPLWYHPIYKYWTNFAWRSHLFSVFSTSIKLLGVI